jgi:hypothetical protein
MARKVGSHMQGGEAEEHFKQFQAADPYAASIVCSSKSVAAYVLQQDGANPGWRHANIEGPVYVIRRRVAPWYQLIVKNKNSQNNLTDFLHPGLELDCQKNCISYKVEDTSKRSRRLWFHDDAERIKLEGEMEAFLKGLRMYPSGPPPDGWQPAEITHNAGPPSVEETANADEKAELILRENPKYN